MVDQITNKSRLIWLILAISILFYCLDYFFRISPSVVLMPLMQQYHINALQMGTVASAFYIGYVIAQIPTGLMLDRWSFNRVLIPALLLCTISFISFIYASNYSIALATRFLIGLSSAVSFLGVLFVAQVYLAERHFATICGITISLGTFAASAIQFVSAVSMRHWGWHGVFLCVALGGIFLALLLCLPKLQLNKPQQQLSDTLPLRRAWQLLHHRSFMLNGLIGSLFYLPTTVFSGMWGLSFLTLQYSLNKTQAASCIMFIFLGWGIGSPLVGWLIDKWPHPKRCLFFSALAATLISCILLLSGHLSLPSLEVLSFLFGLSSSFQVVVWKVFQFINGKQLSGTAIALTNMIIMLSGALFHTVVGWLIDVSHTSSATTTHYTASNFKHALLIIPVAFILAGLFTTRIKMSANSIDNN